MEAIAQKIRSLSDAIRQASEAEYSFRVLLGSDGSILLDSLSEEYSTATGRTIEEVRTADQWKSVVHSEDFPKLMAFVKSLIATGKGGSVECRSVSKDNNPRQILILASPEWSGRQGSGKKMTAITGTVHRIESKPERSRFKESPSFLRKHGLPVKEHKMRIPLPAKPGRAHTPETLYDRNKAKRELKNIDW